MSANTKIEWCDSTWNPVTGCLHGCEYCYARRIANRFSDDYWYWYSPECGLQAGYRNPEKSGLHVLEEKVYKTRECKQACAYPFGFEPTLYRYRLDVPQKWKKSRTIFVCSMADLFGAWVPDEWIEQVFEACLKAPWHRYLFLTKNPKRYAELAKNNKLPLSENMWYGTTLNNCKDIWFCSPSAMYNTFLSIEPIQSDFSPNVSFFGTNWIIIGAETGNQKGKIIPEKSWIDHICEAAGDTPVFMKDSLIPIVGEENMRREFPWGGKNGC